MNTRELKKLLNVAEDAVRVGYSTALSSSVHIVESNFSVHDYTTSADINAAKKIKDLLIRYTPVIPILIEEGIKGDKWEYINDFLKKNDTYWVVDPIDGSSNRKNGQFFWGVSVCLVVGGIPTLAAVAYPRLGSLYPNVMTGLITDSEKILLLNGVPLPRIGNRFKDIMNAKIAYDNSYIPEDTTKVMEIILQLRKEFETHSPCQGSQVVTGVNVVLGNLDAHITFHAMPWDIAATLVFMEIIEGKAIDWVTGEKARITSFRVVYGIPTIVDKIVEQSK